MASAHPTPSRRQGDIRAWLENEILEGRLRPGDRVDEQEVCRAFAVSRTPVREALLQLASIDLVEFRPRQGAMVLRISVRQIAAMWEVMTSLEGLCAELAARRMNDAERDALRVVHETSRSAAANGDVDGYDRCNRLFHEGIYVGCRNEYLATHVRDIRGRLRVYRRYPFQRAGGMERSHDGHEAVLQALVAGDGAAAGAAMREHVAGGLSFLDLVAELPPGAVADDGRAPEPPADARRPPRRSPGDTVRGRNAPARPRAKRASS
jgi:DNA-binding GntR family transcriptional regulator